MQRIRLPIELERDDEDDLPDPTDPKRLVRSISHFDEILMFEVSRNTVWILLLWNITVVHLVTKIQVQ